MKMHYLALSVILLGMLPDPASAQLRGFLDRAGGIVKDTLDQASDKVEDVIDAVKKDDSPAATLTPNLDALALTPVDRHDYESALSVSDQMCTEIIDPFLLSDNVSELAEEVIKKDGFSFLRRFTPNGQNADARESLLATAKAGAKQLNWLPMEQEIAYGQTVHEQVLANDKRIIIRTDKGRVKRLYEDADELLAKVMAEIDEEHPYTFQLLLIDNEDINATALPGGFLHLNTGVLESDHAELVLAHEIGHVFKRHQTRETQARLIDMIETADDLKQLLDKNTDVINQTIERAAALYGDVQNYSRQQELQADACAVRMAARIPRIDIDEMIDDYVESIAQTTTIAEQANSNESSSADAILSDQPFKQQSGHPDYPERRQRMKEVSQQLATAQN